MIRRFVKLSKIESLMSGRHPAMNTEEIREKYNKLIEEGNFCVWEAKDPICKVQQDLMKRN